MEIKIDVTDEEAEEIIVIASSAMRMAPINFALRGTAYELPDKWVMRLADAVVRARKGE